MPKISQEEEDFLIAENRHDELVRHLKNIAEDKSVSDAIKLQVSKISALVTAIENLPKPEKSDIKVELNPKDFVSSVQQICADIISSNNKVISAIENRLLPDSFTLKKNNNGVTQSVVVNYKSANKIN